MSYPALQQVPASATILGDEMEVIARHVEPLNVVWEAKTHEAAPDVAELKGWLVLHRFGERRVGLSLPGHAARLYVAEVTFHAHGVTCCSVADGLVQVSTEVRVVH